MESLWEDSGYKNGKQCSIQSKNVQEKNTLQLLVNKTNMQNVRFAHTTRAGITPQYFVSFLNLFNIANAFNLSTTRFHIRGFL